MNRTLLLILCDFLLLTLLALTRWETAEPERPPEPVATQIESEAGAATVADDIVSLMQLSLKEQAAEQAALAQRKAEREAQLAAEIAEREEALQAAKADIANRDTSLARIRQERQVLSADLVASEQQQALLNQRLVEVAGEATASRERLAQLQRDLEAREAEAERQAAELARLAEEQSAAEARIENLNVAVRVAEQEKVLLRETAQTYREQAENERQERLKVQETTTQLAEGVGELAEKSAAISAEIRENRPINANTLFDEFLRNRVPADIAVERPGLFGNQVERQSRPRTILATDGVLTYAVMHVEDTPFNFVEPSADWDRIDVLLRKNDVSSRPPAMYFLRRDARIVTIPVGEDVAESMGVKIYELAQDPFRFPEAVLINNGGQGYGEVPFKLEASLPGYVRMDNRFLRRLVGDFSPSRGDLVLSKTGKLLGIMVTADLCALLTDFDAQATFLTGDTSGQNETATLDRLRQRYERRPVGGLRPGR